MPKCLEHLTTFEVSGGCLLCQRAREEKNIGPYSVWLIEKESPAKYFVDSNKIYKWVDASICAECRLKKGLYESFTRSFRWTYKAENAFHFFFKWEAEDEMKRLISLGAEGDLRVCEHVLNSRTSDSLARA